MAKTTFLELCRTVADECGVPRASLTEVSAATGLLGQIVRWTAQGDQETQARWMDWDFLHASFSVNTVQDTAAVSAPADIGLWDVDSFYLDYSTATHKKLTVLEYTYWRKNMRQGVKTSKKPSYVVIKPDQSLILEAPPDAAYALTADYWKRPAKMTTNTSTSSIPEEYERIIVARAKMYYAEFEAAPELMGTSQVEYDDLLDKLEAKYLPHQSGRRTSANESMVVRTE